MEERYPYLEEEEDIRILDAREEHWKDFSEENDADRSKFHALERGVCMKRSRS